MNPTVKAILIDDEQHNINVLQSLLQKYCPQVNVIYSCSSADEAYLKITELQPQLVFLDIRMPNKSGFDLLKQFTKFNFEVIFVSAFNEYAITAFEFNALGYILKPIDYSKLILAVDKAIAKIDLNHSNETVLHFVQTLEEKNDLVNKISFHHNGKVAFVTIADIVFIEVSADITCITDKTGNKYCSSKDIKLYEDLLIEFKQFVRISRYAIINANCIKSYSKGEVCVIELINGRSFEVSRRKKAEVLEKIKTK
jgi:two-component system, LytTR family, response regulator